MSSDGHRADAPSCRSASIRLPDVAVGIDWRYFLLCTVNAALAGIGSRERTFAMPLALLRLRWRRSALALAVLLVLGFESQLVSAATRIITDADKGGSVRVRLVDILEVRLKCNPTTGYMWYLHPKSTQLLKLIGQSQTQVREPGVGRPILQVFRFQPVAHGDGVLLLHYIRAWEPQVTSNEEQFAVHVSIR